MILEQPDRRTPAGLRDHALLLFLYNTGARVSEALAVRLCDLRRPPRDRCACTAKAEKNGFVPCGKTRRMRYNGGPACEQASPTIYSSVPGMAVAHRDGVAYLLNKYVTQAAVRHRHYAGDASPRMCASQLRGRVAPSGQRCYGDPDYLGHASIATTSRYLTTNLKAKRDALEVFWQHAGISPVRTASWKPKPDLLAFLDSL